MAVNSRSDVPTNAHCLLDSLDRARQLLGSGAFTNAEPEPYRIFAVYSTPWPAVDTAPEDPG